MKASKTFMEKVRDQKGQTMIEYVLVIVLIALVLVIAFGTRTENAVNNAADFIADSIDNATQ